MTPAWRLVEFQWLSIELSCHANVRAHQGEGYEHL